MLIFSPTLVIDGTRYELPRPILSLRLLDSWDHARFKVPLVPGDTAYGGTPAGVDVSIEGQIGTQAGQFKGTETAMFTTLEQLRTLTATGPEATINMILYRDDVTSQEYVLKECSITRFEYDLSDTHLFSYSALIHASDPVIHIELPT